MPTPGQQLLNHQRLQRVRDSLQNIYQLCRDQMDELEDAKEEHIDLEFVHRLQSEAVDEIYDNARRNDIKS